MRPQRTDDFLCEIRLFRVPHKADGNYFWAVHQDLSDPDLLTTVALKERKKQNNNFSLIKTTGIKYFRNCEQYQVVKYVGAPQFRIQ